MFCHIRVLCISLNLIPNGVFPGIFRCGELLTPLRIVKPVEHRAASGLACCNQRLFCTIVGQGVCRRCRNSGDKLVGRIDIDCQRDVLIVCALDHYGHCAHRADGFHVIFLNGQNQLAVFDLCRANGVIAAGQVNSWCAVGHRAVLPGSLQRRQQRGQINRIRRRVVVRDLQRLGRGGSDDRPADRNSHTAAVAVFDLHHPAAIGKDKVAAGCQRHCAGEGSVSGFRGVKFHIAQLVVALVQIKSIPSRQFRIPRVLRIKSKRL